MLGLSVHGDRVIAGSGPNRVKCGMSWLYATLDQASRSGRFAHPGHQSVRQGDDDGAVARLGQRTDHAACREASALPDAERCSYVLSRAWATFRWPIFLG